MLRELNRQGNAGSAASDNCYIATEVGILSQLTRVDNHLKVFNKSVFGIWPYAFK
jgi:hypothetical protein